MSNEQHDGWVQAHTPHEEDLVDDQLDENSEYGQTFEPEEWDDYASEQSVPVASPQPRTEPGVGNESVSQELSAEESLADEPSVEDPLIGEPLAEDPFLEDPAPEVSDEGQTGQEPEHWPSEPVDAAETDEPGYGADGYGGSDEPVRADVDDFHETETTDEPAELSQAEDDFGATAVREPLQEPSEPEYVEEPQSPESQVDPQTSTQTEPSVHDDLEETQAVPVAGLPETELVAAVPAPGTEGMGDVYRASGTGSPARAESGEQTQVLQTMEEQEAEERRIQQQLAAERQARRERLGVVETSDENATRGTAPKPKRTTDKFAGAVALFVLRLVTAAVVGVTGYQMLTPVESTAAVLEATVLPQPELMAWILGFTLAALAVFLVLGLLQRVVGLLLMVYSIGLLAILRWGNFNPFLEQFEGFIGDKELLLAGIGFLLLMVGGGSWGIDGAFRASRAKSKAERQA